MLHLGTRIAGGRTRAGLGRSQGALFPAMLVWRPNLHLRKHSADRRTCMREFCFVPMLKRSGAQGPGALEPMSLTLCGQPACIVPGLTGARRVPSVASSDPAAVPMGTRGKHTTQSVDMAHLATGKVGATERGMVQYQVHVVVEAMVATNQTRMGSSRAISILPTITPRRPLLLQEAAFS